MFTQRLNKLKELINNANPYQREITIVGVTKYTEISQINETVNGELNDLAENKVQRLIELKAQNTSAKLHLIGHLQTNKAKQAVTCADLIQSVDSLKILNEISKEAKKINKIQNILIQVNIAHEDAKFGLYENEASELIKQASETENINLCGLMTIMPIEFNESYYKKMEEFYEEQKTICPNLKILSMGMTNDFETAIRYGSTMIRVGSYLFK